MRPLPHFGYNGLSAILPFISLFMLIFSDYYSFYNTTLMKHYLTLLLLTILLCPALQAQDFHGLDKSPMDMVYFPDDFAHDRRFAPEELEFDRPIMRVIYSRPAKNGREVFGELVPYGKVWRNGANEAPEIKFYENVTLAGKKVKAGSYALLSIPDEDNWTIILSSDVDQWGTYSYDESKDVLRLTAPVSDLDSTVENFTIQFEGAGKGEEEGKMIIAWDQTKVEVPFTF